VLHSLWWCYRRLAVFCSGKVGAIAAENVGEGRRSCGDVDRDWSAVANEQRRCQMPCYTLHTQLMKSCINGVTCVLTASAIYGLYTVNAVVIIRTNSSFIFLSQFLAHNIDLLSLKASFDDTDSQSIPVISSLKLEFSLLWITGKCHWIWQLSGKCKREIFSGKTVYC